MIMSYETFEDWKKDHEKLQRQPNDKMFLDSIVRKVDNSPKDVQEKIKDALMSKMMEDNPELFFRMLKKSIPEGKILFVKSKKDPWFKV